MDGFRPGNLGLDESANHRPVSGADEDGALHFQETGNVIPQAPDDSKALIVLSRNVYRAPRAITPLSLPAAPGPAFD